MKTKSAPSSSIRRPAISKHQRVAVDAGIHVLPVAVTGRTEHLQVFFRDVEHDERKADPLCGHARLCGAEKGGLKGDPQNLDPLFRDDLEGQDAVQTS